MNSQEPIPIKLETASASVCRNALIAHAKKAITVDSKVERVIGELNILMKSWVNNQLHAWPIEVPAVPKGLLHKCR